MLPFCLSFASSFHLYIICCLLASFKALVPEYVQPATFLKRTFIMNLRRPMQVMLIIMYCDVASLHTLL